MTSWKSKIKPPSPRTGIIRQILPTIRRNCSIADAHHSGLFSLCGLFLRLKDQYNWEQKRPPWSPTHHDRLLKWIDRKEALWLECLDSPFKPLRFNHHAFDYLDSRGINQHLVLHGLYYGAGYGRGLRPTFFLGVIRESRQIRPGYTVVILGRELACDLSLAPAQRQGKIIVIRTEPLRFFLWSKIQETEKLEREATAMALSYYGWNSKVLPGNQLELILQSEIETVLSHELGEALDRSLPRGLWKTILAAFPFSRIELYLRTLKDLLADTHPRGTLHHIASEKKAGSLAFYLSNLKGLRGALFPEMVQAIRQFKKEEDWTAVIQANKGGRKRLIGQARRVKELAEEWMPARPKGFSDQFEQAFYGPLSL
jgi:hypothetical protein